ncbi:hypothetical protein FOZ60_017072 [Perkinsus olseni]|uniref:Cathepsin L n=1 Tax=Perkinsus olseni TaxID=32597 RepID=A0A7J6N332_PEROL|nr:hypothetical protein FOZ60_017072 [Perkinsus olseni]
MRKGFTVVVAITIPLASPGEALSEQEIDEAFADFIVRYQKEYHSEAERNGRRGLFAETLMDVVAANEEHDEESGGSPPTVSGISSKYVADINAFADLSAEEFTAGLLCGAPISTPTINLTNISYRAPPNLSDLPESVDWVAAGAVGPVRNQLNCGCCYAIQAATMAEGRFQIKTGIKPLIPFSVQQIVDCSKSAGNNGCEGGLVTHTWVYIQTQGIVKESAYPYTAKDGKCKDSVVTSPANQCLAVSEQMLLPPQAIGHSIKSNLMRSQPRPGAANPFQDHDVVGWRGILPEDEPSLRAAVAEGPVSVRVHASSSRFRNYRFGVMTTKECGEGNLNHAITIIGYGKTPEGVT